MAMSTETGSLILKADATQVESASTSLDNLSASADRADKAVEQLNETTDQQSARLKTMVAASMEKVRAQQAEVLASRGVKGATDANALAFEKVLAASQKVLASTNAQADMNARGAAILASEERARKAATVGIASQTAGLAELIGKIDPSVAALERLDAMQAKLAAFRKSGAISGEDFAVYSAKIDEARSAVGKTTDSVHKLSLNSAMARRELGRMGTDIAQGNFGRLSQTSLTLANYTGLMGLAFSAAGAAILGTVAVVGAFIASAAKGYVESERLRTSVIATGGAAGVSAGQFNDMAESIGAASGKFGDARKAIELLAASGKVAGAGIGGLAQQALNMSIVTGESIDKSVAKILELGQKPADTIASLNEQYHFLTASQYAQIAALEAEGKVREASRLANQLDAQAMAERAKDVQDNAGWMIRAGHSVAEAWGKAWDAMKGVGRTKDLGEQVKAVQDQIDRLTGAVGAGQVDKRVNKPDSPEIRALRAQLEALRHQQAVAGFAASQSALDAQANAESIAAQQRLSSGTPADTTYVNKLNKLRMDRASALYGIVDPQQRALIEAQFANEVKKANDAFQSAASKGAAKERKPGADPFASLNGLVQGAQVKSNTFGMDGQTSQVTSILAIVDAGAKLIASGQDIATVQAKVAVGVAAVNALYAKQAAQIKSQNVVALDQYREAVNNKLAADKMQLDNQVARIGMGQQEYERQTQLNKVYQDYARVIENLQKQRAQKGANTALIDGQIAAQSDARDIAVAQTVASFDEIDKAQGDWLLGAESAYKDYLASAADVAGQSATLFSNSFNSMGDALANFAMTGKLNFRGLVKSILSDLAKMELRIAMSKILQQVLGAYLGGATTQTYAGGPSYIGGNGTGGYGMQIQNAKGGVYSSPSLSAYSGQVVNRPTPFLFASGAGIMGEAGPEAIMPLKRGSDGKLGVVAQGGGGVQLSQTFVIDSNGQSSDNASGAANDDAMRQFSQRMKDVAKQAIMEEQRQGGSLWRMAHS